MFEKYEESIYGLNLILRKLIRYPYFLPLPCWYDHGVSPLMRDYDLFPVKNHKSLILTNNKDLAEKWENKFNIPCFVSGPFFIRYRRLINIKMFNFARGTVVFPGHSSSLVKSFFDISKYCEKLLLLPVDFHPITICLYWYDLEWKKEFEKYRFNVVTAGDPYSKKFVDNFYNILRKYKYSTSNEIGSYTFYSVEMGIPFFILGTESLKINKNAIDPNVPEEYRVTDSYQGKKLKKLFDTGPIRHITKEQKECVSRYIGENEWLSRKKLKKVLLKFIFKRYLFFFLKGEFFFIMGKVYSKFCFFLKRIINKILHLFGISFDLNKSYFWFLRRGLFKADKIFTHLTDREKVLLYEIVKKNLNNVSVCVEIGSYLGASSCFIAKALKKKSILYCIDTWNNETMPEGGKDTYNDFLKNTCKYKKKIKTLRGFSNNIINDFKSINKKIDFLFIDGDHSYESCKQDWNLYSPLLKNNALIAFHDTGWAEGVKKVVKDEVVGSQAFDCVCSLPNMKIFKKLC